MPHQSVYDITLTLRASESATVRPTGQMSLTGNPLRSPSWNLHGIAGNKRKRRRKKDELMRELMKNELKEDERYILHGIFSIALVETGASRERHLRCRVAVSVCVRVCEA